MGCGWLMEMRGWHPAWLRSRRRRRGMPHDDSVKYSTTVTDAELETLASSVKFAVDDGWDEVTWPCPRCCADQVMRFKRDRPIYEFDVKTSVPRRDPEFLISYATAVTSMRVAKARTRPAAASRLDTQ